ncbi:hypothetical protein RJ640_004361 [Escallonia rubra]|uniref:MADS-box domain-containing protein n=1 Tax=Escallonia rubra TaxID=112253 RepID=A0AA88SCG0_9ASTE|nr:hypothetical protein RJ640_004361 [Escallonia rubra]
MGTGKKKIEIKKRENKSSRMVTFSKRRQGLFKKAQELHNKTGVSIAVLVFSPAGRPYTHGHPSFEATVNKYYSSMTMSRPDATAAAVKEAGTDDNGDDKVDFDVGLCGSWLDSVKVDQYDDVRDLEALSKSLDEFRERLAKKVDHA